MEQRQDRWTSAEPQQFRHRLLGRVHSHEVDRQGIVHNAVYLYWLEVARVEYFRALGLAIDRQTFITKHRFVVARIEIDYRMAAQFDDEYEILSRVAYVGRTSLGFEQLVRRLPDHTLLAHARTVMVHLNPATHKPERIQDAYRTLIRQYEGETVHIEAA
ncbi:MAG: acyl-CoA thioesterase [Candidatus Kapabacteria bacterium]|nr:acyl-CoA thioesterase [Candidatus Kapabacteria bacterium]MDW8012799.1 thioesterase family protein [Bacteroidota bacterium]